MISIILSIKIQNINLKVVDLLSSTLEVLKDMVEIRLRHLKSFIIYQWVRYRKYLKYSVRFIPILFSISYVFIGYSYRLDWNLLFLQFWALILYNFWTLF